MPVLTANALAHHQGLAIAPGVLAWTLAGMLLAQSGVNLVNDVFDDRSGLDADPEFEGGPFPLGSRVIQRGQLTRGAVARLALVAFLGAAVCGLVLDRRHEGHVVLAIALAGGVLGYFYTAPPLRIAYHGAGEPITFLLFGPLAGLGAYYAQTGRFDLAALLLASIVGLLAMAILFLHHFPQRAADEKHGKRTPVVRLGERRAGRLVGPLLAAPYVLVAGGVALGAFGWGATAFFLTAPRAVRVARTAARDAADGRLMARAVGGVLAVHFLGGIALSVGLWWT